MNLRTALSRGGVASAACVACCAPPIIAALGVTAGLAAATAVFLGLAAGFTALLIGGAWIAARLRRARSPEHDAAPVGSVPVAAPLRRAPR